MIEILIFAAGLGIGIAIGGLVGERVAERLFWKVADEWIAEHVATEHSHD